MTACLHVQEELRARPGVCSMARAQGARAGKQTHCEDVTVQVGSSSSSSVGTSHATIVTQKCCGNTQVQACNYRPKALQLTT